MRIVSILHFATPYRSAGSETVAHHMLKTLVEAGHDVRCYVTDCPGEQETVYEGVRLIPVRNVMVACTEARRWKAEIWLSHHQNAAMTIRFARGAGARSVFWTHNDMDVNMIPLRFQPDLVIHNAEWVKESLNRYPIEGQQTVIHPPLDCERHRVWSSVADRTHVTLINVNEHKGGKIMFELARRMRDIPFMGVQGGHGVQVKPPRNIPNLKMVAHGPDLKPVWSKTRLLIMPSIYESYGLVGIEAGCSGIPTLANHTPGLAESLGAAGMFVMERENLNEWEVGIRSMFDDTAYSEASTAARVNSDQKCVQTTDDMARFTALIEELPTLPPVVYTRQSRGRTSSLVGTTRR